MPELLSSAQGALRGKKKLLRFGTPSAAVGRPQTLIGGATNCGWRVTDSTVPRSVPDGGPQQNKNTARRAVRSGSTPPRAARAALGNKRPEEPSCGCEQWDGHSTLIHKTANQQSYSAFLA